jgi:glutathione S-transferase
MMPRPDIALLNVHYRRIPVMAIGRDVYCDTRIQLRKLEQLFPGSALSPTSPEAATLQKLFEIWAIEGGLFARASQLIPSEMPLLKDPKFQKDREDFSGRPWTKENIDKNRPEALVMARKGFVLLEGLMKDGRDWVQKTKEPTLADIEGKCKPPCECCA